MIEIGQRVELQPSVIAERCSRVFLMTESLQTGGTERQFTITARSLKKHFDVKLGCATRRGELLDSIGEISEFDTGQSMLGKKAWSAGRQLAKYFRDQNIQIAHSFDFYGNMLMIPAALSARVPVVIGSHRGIGNVFSGQHQLAQALVFCFADCIVCNCIAAADRLALYGVPRRKITIIPNFIPDEVFAECAPALPRKAGVVRLGMVGRMNHPVKNYPLLLRGAARLASRFPNLEIVLVGDGHLRPGLQTMAQELGIADKVLFLGERRDVPAIMRSLDIAVLTSDSEGLSNAILEAMAAGLPVVATRVGGNVELIADSQTGFLFPVGSDEGFAHQVEKLLLDVELRRRMGALARSRALAKYQMSSVLEQFRKLYLTLLLAKGVVPAI